MATTLFIALQPFSLGFSDLPTALSSLDASKVSICNVNRAASKAITKAVSHVAFPAGRAAGTTRPFFPKKKAERSEGSDEHRKGQYIFLEGYANI
jgi:hypothetical protein